jgi:hypothetical protein
MDRSLGRLSGKTNAGLKRYISAGINIMAERQLTPMATATKKPSRVCNPKPVNINVEYPSPTANAT